LILFISSLSFSFAQKTDSLQFELKYTELIQYLSQTEDSLENLVGTINNGLQLDYVQQARLNFIKIRVHDLYKMGSLPDEIYDPVIDSSKNQSPFTKAINLVVQSRLSTGVPLLLEFIETADENSDSAVYAKIYLAEGYRKIGEYQKGIDIINELLNNDGISSNNRAFAYNRIAALYAECGTYMVKHRYDSVLKYSNLCIKISEENGFTRHLAASQNELAYFYLKRKEHRLALDYGTSAYDNFIKAKMLPQALSSSTNIAKIYIAMGKPYDAIKILKNALDLGDINEYQNLFVSIYLSLAGLNREIGNISSAYEYLKIARGMQVKLSKARSRAHIYDMSAKYETEKKEKENLALRLENEIKELKLNTKNKTINLLIAGILIIAVSFIIILKQFYQKKKALIILAKRNLEIVKREKEYGLLSDAVDGIGTTYQAKSSVKNHSKDDSHELIDKLNAYMKNEKPYLFSDVNLDDVSQKLNTNRTYLSKLINEHYNKNFNDFINEFRVKTARQILADPGKNHISIEGVGQMAGFNSRSNFFTCFKKYTGISPSYFRQSIE